MIGTVGAIVASAVIGGAVSMFGANKQAKAAKQGADTQLQATRESIASNEKALAQQREDQKPWRDAGMAALEQLKTGIADGSFDPKNFEFTEDPGYQFRLQQGQKAIERSASARGNALSAGTQLAIQGYGQEFAANEYGAAYDRNASTQNARFNALASVAGTGQRATDVIGAATGSTAANNANLTVAGGNAVAQGYIGAADAWSKGANGLATAANTGIQNYLLQGYLK